MIEALLLDLSGVLYNGDTLISGALQAVELAQRCEPISRPAWYGRGNTVQVMKAKSVAISTPLIR